MKWIQRSHNKLRVLKLLADFPVVGVLGARQVGKTSLARDLMESWEGASTRFDLEDPRDLARLNDPMLAFSGLAGLVIVDEIQRLPDLFPALRVLVDRPASPVRFLILGSASPTLLRQSSESLAGRIAYHELSGFSLDEVGLESAGDLWRRGGFPRSFLAASETSSVEWRQQFLRTFLERDIPQLGSRISSPMLGRFWAMLAHRHGQVWKGSDFARGLGVAESTVRRYLDLLAETLVVHVLPPWSENISKRQVRSPKVYVADSGLLHALLNIDVQEDLERHPVLGGSWEGFLIRELVRHHGARPGEFFFWSAHSGFELDLLIVRGQERLGFEIKRTTAPRLTSSMAGAVEDLKLDALSVIHAGDHSFSLGRKVRALTVAEALGPGPSAGRKV